MDGVSAQSERDFEVYLKARKACSCARFNFTFRESAGKLHSLEKCCAEVRTPIALKSSPD